MCGAIVSVLHDISRIHGGHKGPPLKPAINADTPKGNYNWLSSWSYGLIPPCINHYLPLLVCDTWAPRGKITSSLSFP
jgi:hypothetical protein